MEIGSDQLKLVAFLSLIADRIQIWFEQRRWKMVACTSSTSAFKLLHTSPVFLHQGSPLLKFNTWHYQCYNWNEVARLFLPGAAFVSVALMVHLILSLPIMFLFLLLPPLLVEKQRLWLQKLFPLFSTKFSAVLCFSVSVCFNVWGLQCFRAPTASVAAPLSAPVHLHNPHLSHQRPAGVHLLLLLVHLHTGAGASPPHFCISRLRASASPNPASTSSP